MKSVLNKLIMQHKGPYKGYSAETMNEYHNICTAVAAEVICTILGVHPEACDGVCVAYYFYDDIWFEVTFTDRATHTAEQIATAFEEITGVRVSVKVWEAVSEYEAKQGEQN